MITAAGDGNGFRLPDSHLPANSGILDELFKRSFASRSG
jgi:hypothetical protein